MLKRWPVLIFAILIGILIFFSSVMEGRFKPVEKKDSLVVYTTLPREVVNPLATAYEREYNVHWKLFFVTEKSVIESVNASGKLNDADLFLGDESVLRVLDQAGQLANYGSPMTAKVDPQFKAPDGAWIGMWYVPMVIAMRSDVTGTAEELTWDDIFYGDRSIVIADFMTNEFSEEWLYSLVEQYGDEGAFERLLSLHTKIVQYVKEPAMAVRFLVINQADIAISDAQTIRSAIIGNAPIQMVYPTGGTAYQLIGGGIDVHSENYNEAARVVDWLLNGHAFLELHRQYTGLYYTGIPNKVYWDANRDQISLWNLQKHRTVDGRKSLLERWLVDIRFPKESSNE